jgi:hypothetical protein
MTKFILPLFFLAQVAFAGNQAADNFYAYQSIRFYDPAASGFYTKMQAAALGGNWTMTLPTGAGTNTFCLKTDGFGVTSWKACQSPISSGNLTDAGTDGITVGNGSGAVLGSGTTLSQQVADTSHNGYLSGTDWNTFNGKGSGSVTSVAMTVPALLSISGSPITTSGTLALSYSGTALPVANGGTGQVTAAAAFNALSPITTTGDIIYSPSGATSQRLGIGSTGNVLTVSGGVPAWAPPATAGTVTTTGSPANGNLTKFSGSTSITNGDLSGDITTSGTLATTLATVNSNVGSFTLSSITVNGKGLVTAASSATTPLTVAQTTVASQALTTCTTARTVDWSTGNNFTLTLTNGDACALTWSNAASGQSICIDLYQAASGGGTATVTFATTTLKPNSGAAYTMTTGNAATDTICIKYNGTDYRLVAQQIFQ